MPKNEKKYYKRLIDSVLLEWKTDVDKKPLLLRGARQVGKFGERRRVINHQNVRLLAIL